MDWLKDKGRYKDNGHTTFWSSLNASIRCILYSVSIGSLKAFEGDVYKLMSWASKT